MKPLLALVSIVVLAFGLYVTLFSASSMETVPEETVMMLGLLQGPGMMFFYLGSLVFLARYSISRERYRDILHQLDLRRRGTE